MIPYIIKSILCLTLLLAFYHLFLEREKMHIFNRLYLIGSATFSLLVPLYVIYKKATYVTTPFIITERTITQYTETNIEQTFNYTPYIIGIYAFISLVLLFRFVKNLLQIIQTIRNNERISLENATLVLVEKETVPHSFLSFIFVNKSDYLSQKITNEVLTHEMTHIRQKHSIDILFVEILQVIFWLNPSLIFLKKAIKLNHEFLADQKVIQTYKNISKYQYLLLETTTCQPKIHLASNLNYLLTKKRLKMMTTTSSKTAMMIKKMAVLPLLVSAIFLFAQRVEAQKKVVERPDYDTYKEYSYRNQKVIYADKKTGKKVKKSYQEMTKEEREMLPPPLPLTLKKKVPSSDLLKKLEDSNKYALWIDDKVVKNSILKNYSASDFSNYFVSFVYKNARSKRFPQEYQASLTTNEYFKAKNKKRADDYSNYLKQKKAITEGKIIAVSRSDKKQKSSLKWDKTKKDKPLVIVDGKEIPYKNLSKISPESIKNISILKDKKAIEKYGKKAKNGVIIVTLK